MIIYFMFGAGRPRGEQEQMMALSVRQPEYLDIMDPWLDSPNWRKLSIRTA
jgi:hypothetical protein